ncbi:hypothetical protein B0H14DRAFT_3857495 [Mycena olivaceomarginata]|nr:hypothetical protein B0H14DRAFT_3857495 [Mycena olivaceomarginata]
MQTQPLDTPPPQVDHLHRIRQAGHRSQASPAVILVGSTLATLGSTTGTTPADPCATPYLPSPSVIPLAPPATPSVLLPLDRVRCLGSTALPSLSRPIALSALGSPSAVPIPILPLTKILARSWKLKIVGDSENGGVSSQAEDVGMQG